VQATPGRVGSHARDPTELIWENSGEGRYGTFIAKLEFSRVALNIAHLGDAIRLSWPPLAGGFLLEESTNLFEPNAWSRVANGTNGAVLQTVAAPQTFFRLARP
jgi:hypothetical protein